MKEIVKNINFLGIILLWISYLVGIKYPDWDFKMKLKHRNMLTHSPAILWVMIYFYKLYGKYSDVDIFRFCIVGFSLAIGLHMIFDFFPKGWFRGALIHYPFSKKSIGVRNSKIFIFLTVIYSLFLTVKYLNNYIEFIVVLLLGYYTILKNRKKEKKLIRPIIFLTITILILGASKFPEVSGIFYKIIHIIGGTIYKLY